MKTELRLLVNSKDKLATRKRVRAGELSELDYISPGPTSPTHRLVEQALLRFGVQPRSNITVEDPALAILMVELGRGQTFIPALQAPSVERSGSVKALLVQSLPPLQMVWAALSFAGLPEAATDFLSVFDERIKRKQSSRGRTQR